MRTWGTVASVFAAFTAGCVALTSELKGPGLVYHLPKSIITLTVTQYSDSSSGKIWYTLGGPELAAATVNGASLAANRGYQIISETVPDPEHRYVIEYQPSALSDDRLCLSRKPNGLLHDVQFAADDRTPEVIFNIARFVAGGMGSPSKEAFVEENPAQGTQIVASRKYTSRIDPFDEDDVGAFNRALKRVFNSRIQIDVSRMFEMIKHATDTWPKGCDIRTGRCPKGAWAKRCDREHICYRTKLSLPIDLELDGVPIDVKYADVVNARDIGSISVQRAFLVQKITKLRFDDGALLAAIIRKPSEVEEVTLLPLNVVNAVLSTPSGLWQAAFTDQQFKQATLKQLAQQQADITQLQQSNRALMMQGASPIDDFSKEKYDLNCRDPVSTTGLINLLQ